jgi:hypothetical protein
MTQPVETSESSTFRSPQLELLIFDGQLSSSCQDSDMNGRSNSLHTNQMSSIPAYDHLKIHR